MDGTPEKIAVQGKKWSNSTFKDVVHWEIYHLVANGVLERRRRNNRHIGISKFHQWWRWYVLQFTTCSYEYRITFSRCTDDVHISDEAFSAGVCKITITGFACQGPERESRAEIYNAFQEGGSRVNRERSICTLFFGRHLVLSRDLYLISYCNVLLIRRYTTNIFT